jgi:hypothetical protein
MMSLVLRCTVIDPETSWFTFKEAPGTKTVDVAANIATNLVIN